jgi:hypothetical protein
LRGVQQEHLTPSFARLRRGAESYGGRPFEARTEQETIIAVSLTI